VQASRGLHGAEAREEARELRLRVGLDTPLFTRVIDVRENTVQLIQQRRRVHQSDTPRE
jgi:hypothetical protein